MSMIGDVKERSFSGFLLIACETITIHTSVHPWSRKSMEMFVEIEMKNN